MEFRNLINELQEIIYIADAETYELYFLNDKGRLALGVKAYDRRKCYEVLQGKSAPCEFCNNNMLGRSDFYIWEHSNSNNGRHYILKDKLIIWRGKLCRLEIALDITEKESTSLAVKQKLDLERVLVDCIKTLTAGESLDEAVNAVLEKICRFHEADRAYIFELAREKGIIKNTYEWCMEGVQPQKEFLQEIQAPPYWLRHFEKQENIIIENLENDKNISPEEYDILKMQNIKSLMVVPFYKNGRCAGFVGVDNPGHMLYEISLLKSLTYFFVTEMKKRRIERRMEYMSYHDALTGANNRNKYIGALESLEGFPVKSLGVAFIDLNGLKEINDKYGHSRGDEAIKGTCRVIKNHFRHEDVYRIGGDEFVVIASDMPENTFLNRIDAVKKEIEETKSYSVAVGCVWTDKKTDIRSITEKADNIMYLDKKRHYSAGGSGEYGKKRPAACGASLPDDIMTEHPAESSCEALCRDTYGHIFRVNAKTAAVTHLHADKNLDYDPVSGTAYQMVNHVYDNRLHPNDKKMFKEIWQAIINGSADRADFEYRMLGRDKKYRWTKVCAVREPGGDVCVGIKDLTAMFEKYQLYSDHITGLMTQNMFYAEAKSLMNSNPENTYYVIIMDIDKFKIINDIYGTETGNRALVFIAEKIKNNIKGGEICSKMYADTFCIMKRASSDEEIKKFIGRLSKELTESEFGGLMKSYYGIAKVKGAPVPVLTVCDMANYAHKDAKEKGILCSFYNEGMKQKALEIKRMEQEMETALKEGRFKVYLQPKYDTAKKKVVGAEALVRWAHSERGMIPPAKFIPLFEHNGFIVKLEHFIWDYVCGLLRRWTDEGREVFPISVNVSRAHLMEKNFVKNAVDAPDRWNLPRRLLELEFTESIFTENTDNFSAIVKALQHENMTVEMDDFGSGYSSLNLLKNIPVDVIKLDCAFFGNSESISKKEKIILSHTISMASELGIKIVAEGVGIQEQVDFLLEQNCAVIQGYYFYKPMPVDEFETVVFGV